MNCDGECSVLGWENVWSGVCVASTEKASVQYFNWCCNCSFPTGQPVQGASGILCSLSLSLVLRLKELQLILNSPKFYPSFEELSRNGSWYITSTCIIILGCLCCKPFLVDFALLHSLPVPTFVLYKADVAELPRPRKSVKMLLVPY